MANNSIFDILNRRKAKKLSSKSSEFFQFAKLIRAGKIDIKDKTILDLFLYSLSSNPHNLSLKKDEKMISIQELLSLGAEPVSLFSNPTIASEIVNGNYSKEELAEAGISEQQILNNDVIITKSVDRLKQLVETKDIYSFLDITQKEGIFTKIINRPDLQNTLAQIIDVQTFGNRFVDDKLYLVGSSSYFPNNDKQSFSVLLNLGYNPYEKGVEELMTNNRKQTFLSDMGALTKDVVSRMYRYKFEKYSEWIKKGGEEPKLYIDSRLVPRDDDEFANYYRNQSNLLQSDAIEFFMNQVKSEMSYSNYSGEKPSVESLFTKEGLPTGKLFKVDLNNAIHNEQTMKFLVSNLELIPENIQNVVKIWDKLGKGEDLAASEEAKQRFVLFLSKGENASHSSSYFDKNGPTFLTHQVALQDQDLLLLLHYIEPDLEKNYTINQLQYMKCFMKHSFIYDIMYSWSDGNSFENVIDEYFDHTGLNQNFYKSALRNKDTIKLLPLLENWQSHYNDAEMGFYNIASKYPAVHALIIKRGYNIEDYFSSGSFKPELGRLLFERQQWGALLSIGKEDNRIFSILDDKQKKIIEDYSNIQKSEIRSEYRALIMSHYEEISLDRLDELKELVNCVENSNSNEVRQFGHNLFSQLINEKDPIGKFNTIEKLFLEKNIPLAGKLFSVFKIMHPNYETFSSPIHSPTLKRLTSRGKDTVIFADLMKSFLGSNNREIKSFLRNIDEGNKLFLQITNGQLMFEQLNKEQIQTLSIFSSHLNALYNNTTVGKTSEKPRELTGDVVEDINGLMNVFSPNVGDNYNLPDRIISMFCHPAGFDTFEQVNNYVSSKIEEADKRNRDLSRLPLILSMGDLVKGVDSKYLDNILQNGSLSVEFLGESSNSDLTPLDTDVSIITAPTSSISEALGLTSAKDYGDAWFVLKNRADRFSFTLNNNINTDIIVDEKADLNKLEVFYARELGESHYAIRTGFASSEIDCILVKERNPKVELEIVKNGFYIPVVDKNTGELLFTPEAYDNLRLKTQGLSYYDGGEFKFADNLMTPEVQEIVAKLEDNRKNTLIKSTVVTNVIAGVLRDMGLEIKDSIDGDLTEGSAEFIDTGSTGRGTNKPNDGDFDFMMKVDKRVYDNPTKMDELRTRLAVALGKTPDDDGIKGGDFRLKNVSLEGLDEPIEVDITFASKTNKVTYSTDMCIKDRMQSIYEQDPAKHDLVVANIILAKQILKEAGIYKPDRGDNPQGGLGGVGVENWILQNGGSFESAAASFLAASKGKSFDEFKKSYQIWDFGQNHMAEGRKRYPHDEFVSCNMSQDGYIRMQAALEEYFKKKEYSEVTTIAR